MIRNNDRTNRAITSRRFNDGTLKKSLCIRGFIAQRARGTNVPRIGYKPEFGFLLPKRVTIARGNVTLERVKQ